MDKTTKQKIAENIKDLRKDKNLTQKELAKIIGVSYGSIVDYENARREPNSKAMVALERYFNVSGEFLRGELKKEEFYRKSGQINSGLDDAASLFDAFSKQMLISSQDSQIATTEVFKAFLIEARTNLLSDGYEKTSIESLELLIKNYSKLNVGGHDELVKRMDELLELKRYRR